MIAAGVVVLVVLSITSHEAAHGFVADRLGDPTARELGRLTLNPIPHIDLLFTVALPVFLFLSGSPFILGGAKPVPVDVSRLRNPRRDWALVGLAGPATNLLIATALAALLSVLRHAGVLARTSAGTEILTVGMLVNVVLAVFNLVPIPPLDGSRVVQYFLGGAALRGYRQLERIGLLAVLLLVLFVPPARYLLATAVFAGLWALAATFGVAREVEFVLRHLA
ncbi:MAG TPA: site-2 protease family protein [Candidatus Binatia bacterium]|nr:site-2 protease family protein [Candidatus Binatia bacterium]